ncbi:alpha-2-macroglobulin family protein [uncultured Cohaesibacter sp.]|uniref:alpha-2-macroglobulin family protein n=1 Tax=uncultured Cohaesibacter sp. TaxID=1002546 RepID=UPI0029C906D7|nr:alpha-2-macroglobulin family protein [uncultured Cohaesibacter sp.]
MTRAFATFVIGLMAFSGAQFTAHAQDGGGSGREIVIEKDTDYFGYDLETRKKISLDQCQTACLDMQSCRAFTYNVKAKFCFLKSDIAQATAYKGAISGRVVLHEGEQGLGAPEKLSLLTDSWHKAARDFKREHITATAPTGGFVEFLERGHSQLELGNVVDAIKDFRAALSVDPESSSAWNSLSGAYARYAREETDSNKARRSRSAAVTSALNAYNSSRYRSDRAAALSQLARSLQAASWFRESLSSYKLSLALEENPRDRAEYEALLRTHGFRMTNHTLNSDIKVPRVCMQFSEDLKKGFGDFASYIRVDQQPPKALDVSQQQICVEGLAHGRSYQIDLREGLPANNGEALLSNIQLDVFVRDRAPSLRFSGNNYVLPASNRRGIPVVSVNSEEAKLKLYRVSDRSLANLMRGGEFLSQLDSWEVSDLTDNLGSPVWEGSLDIRPELNEEVITAIPIDEALPDRQPGVYLMTAATTKHDLKDYATLASQWFVISDIGLTTFASTSGNAKSDNEDLGGLQVFARSLETAEPLANLKVDLIARNNEILASGTSDDDGMVTFDAGYVRGTAGLEPAVITASNGKDDFVFLDLTRAGFDLSDRGVTGRDTPQGLDVYAWTERGVYRPGEEVHLNALARDDGANAVDDLPLTFIIERPDGVEAGRLIGSGEQLGGYAVGLPLTTNARRGTWHARVYTDTDKPALADLMFLVEDFIPDRTDMTLTPASEIVGIGEAAKGTVEGRYLYGAPASGLQLSGEVLVREVRSREGFDGYVFGLDEADNVGVERSTLGALQPLDMQGLGAYEFTLDTLKVSTRPRVADLVLRMQEGSGRAIERRVRYRVSPLDTMLGVKPLFEDRKVSENTSADFQLIAVAPDGSRTNEDAVDWSLVKIDRHYQWYRDGSRWNYEAIDIESKVADGQVSLTTDEPAKLSLPVEWGRYRLSLGDATSVEFNAGWSSVAGSIDTPDGLELALDKPSYKAGEIAKLKISPRFEGKLLIAIGTDRIRQTMAVDVPATGTTIDIPVKQSWGAGAYLLANLYRPADVKESRNPARAIGVQWLSIDPEDRALTIAMEAPAKLRPHEQMVVPVKVNGLKAGEEAYVTVALVDEGILNLTNYKTPDPVGRYFGQRKLGVAIRDLYGRLIDGSAGAFGSLRTGGDGGGPQMQSAGDKPTQELVAFVSGIVKVDENGEAEVAFDIPQFNGTARLMATAWTAKAVGSSEKDNIIREPIVVHASLPKVLAPGDQAEALIEMTNLEAPVGDYRIDVVTSDAIALDMSQMPRVVKLPEGKMVSLSVPLMAEKVGVGDVTVKLVSTGGDGLGVLHEAAVPVRSGVLPVTKVTNVPLSPNGGQLVINKDLLSGFKLDGAELSVSVAEEGSYDVASLLMQLDRYPYGCAEQTASRALPLLYAKDIALQLPRELQALSGKQMEERLQKAVDKLLSYQSNAGGFTLWGNSYADDPWLTAYVTDFLTRAKERGLDVPAKPLQLALTSIRNRLAYQSDLEQDSSTVAYALYVLARSRMASAGDLRYYVETKLNDFKTPIARAQLGAALALYGDRTRAEKAFNSALSLAQSLYDKQSLMPEETSYSFSSLHRDVAAMQALAGEMSPAPASLDGIKALSRALYDPERRLNTQEQAWMVLAARADLAQKDDFGLSINGEAVEGSLSTSVSGDALAEEPMTVTNGGDKPLMAQITTIATPDEPLQAGGDGFVISRAYYRLDGSPLAIGEVKQNERLVVVINASQIPDLPSRIMISDLLPAGLEIENPHLLKNTDMDAFNWLPQSNITHIEFRDDRLLAAVDREVGGNRDFTIAYTVRAVTPGTFMHPAAVIEDMYRPQMSARTASGFLTVLR